MIENLRMFVEQPRQLMHTITVTDLDIRSVLNKGTMIKQNGKRVLVGQGKYNSLLRTFANSLSMQAQNRSPYKDYHQSAILSIMIDESRTFQGLMNKIKEYRNTLIKTGYQWNQVYYGHYQHRGRLVSSGKR